MKKNLIIYIQFTIKVKQFFILANILNIYLLNIKQKSCFINSNNNFTNLDLKLILFLSIDLNLLKKI